MMKKKKNRPAGQKGAKIMEENKEKYGDAEIRGNSPLWKRLDNFWYHYKWHTLIALFAIFVVVICTLQTCSRESYDIHILYAGNREVKRTSASGGVIEYETFLDDLARIGEDFDGNGKVSVSLKTLFSLTPDEIKEIEKNHELEVNRTLLQQDAATLSQLMTYGDYYLCFLSESVYRDYRDRDGISLFVPLASYAAGREGVRLTDGGDGIYLSSVDFGSLPLLADFPDDTVICLRALTEFTEKTDRTSRKKFENSEKMLENLLAFRKK